MAIAHSILVAAYYMLQRDEPYSDLGADWLSERNHQAHARRLVSQLEHLGYRVVLDNPPRKSQPHSRTHLALQLTSCGLHQAIRGCSVPKWLAAGVLSGSRAVEGPHDDGFVYGLTDEERKVVRVAVPPSRLEPARASLELLGPLLKGIFGAK